MFPSELLANSPRSAWRIRNAVEQRSGSSRRSGFLCLQEPLFAFDFPFELRLSGQVLHVLGCEHLLVFAEDGVSRHGFILLSAKDKADGWPVSFCGELVVEETDVAVHLTDVSMVFPSPTSSARIAPLDRGE